MGYQNGLGLGKNKQGITDPVTFLANPGKCGLGLQLKHTGNTDEVNSKLRVVYYHLKFIYCVLGDSYRAESSMVGKCRWWEWWMFDKRKYFTSIYCKRSKKSEYGRWSIFL